MHKPKSDDVDTLCKKQTVGLPKIGNSYSPKAAHLSLLMGETTAEETLCRVFGKTSPAVGSII